MRSKIDIRLPIRQAVFLGYALGIHLAIAVTALAETHGPADLVNAPAPQEVSALEQKIEKSLEDALRLKACDAELLQIAEIEKAFLALPRTVEPSHIYRLKYMTIHWRRQMEKLCPEHPALASQGHNAPEPFHGMGIVATRPANKDDKLGPESSDWNTWRTHDDFRVGMQLIDAKKRSYQHRGVVYEPGDMILIEQNTEVCTPINTCFAKPRSLFSHMGIFVVMKEGNDFVPGVLEIFDHGLRFLPLPLYVSKRFTHYSEVHRLKDRKGDDWAEHAETAARNMLSRKWAYNFYPKDGENECNCSSTPNHFFKEMGVAGIASRSQVVPETRNLLKQANLDFAEYLTPTDYRFDPALEMVGVVDNGQLEALMASELLLGHPSQLKTAADSLAHRPLLENKLGFIYGLKLGTLEDIYAREGVDKEGKPLSSMKLAGWSDFAHFPKAPPKALAILTTIEPAVKDAVAKLRGELLTGKTSSEAVLTLKKAIDGDKTGSARRFIIEYWERQFPESERERALKAFHNYFGN